MLDFSWLLKGKLGLDPDCCRCLSHRLFYIMLMQSSHRVLQKALVNIVGFITCVRCHGWPTGCSGPNAFRTGILNTSRNKLQWIWTTIEQSCLAGLQGLHTSWVGTVCLCYVSRHAGFWISHRASWHWQGNLKSIFLFNCLLRKGDIMVSGFSFGF